LVVEEAAEGVGAFSTLGNAEFRGCLFIGMNGAQEGINLGKFMCSVSAGKLQWSLPN